MAHGRRHLGSVTLLSTACTFAQEKDGFEHVNNCFTLSKSDYMIMNIFGNLSSHTKVDHRFCGSFMLLEIHDCSSSHLPDSETGVGKETWGLHFAEQGVKCVYAVLLIAGLHIAALWQHPTDFTHKSVIISPPATPGSYPSSIPPPIIFPLPPLPFVPTRAFPTSLAALSSQPHILLLLPTIPTCLV